jgi:pyruvate kinase
MSKTGKKAAILLDTKGPEIRTIDFAVADNGFIGGEGESLARFQGDVVAAFQLDGTNLPSSWKAATTSP